MDILADNPLTRLSDKLIGKLSLAKALISDIHQLLLPQASTLRLQKGLYLLGLCYAAYKTVKLLGSLCSNWAWVFKHSGYRKHFSPTRFKERYGENSWALVTGFGSGIGFAYACELAKMGFNLVLVDYHKDLAAASERWIRQRNSAIRTHVVVLDLTSSSSAVREQLQASTADKDISILINNAGMAADGRFETFSLCFTLNTIKLNMLAVLEVSKVFLPRMRERPTRSAIINVASAFGEFPSPFCGVYSATKQFVRMFSEALHLENADKVDVMSVKPLGVMTGMMKFKR